MFVAIIPSATFAGGIAAYLVQKIFFTIAGTFVYLYLFLSVPRLLRPQSLGTSHDHPAPVDPIVAGGAVLIVLLGPHLLAPGEEALGDRRRRAARSSPARRRTSLERSYRRFSSLAVQARRDRDLPGGVRDPGDVPVDHEGDRRARSRTSSRVTPGGVGVTQATTRCAQTLLDVTDDDGGRVLARPAVRSRPPGTSSSRSSWSSGLWLDGRQGCCRPVLRATPRSRSPSRRRSARRRRQEKRADGGGGVMDAAIPAAWPLRRGRRLAARAAEVQAAPPAAVLGADGRVARGRRD